MIVNGSGEREALRDATACRKPVFGAVSGFTGRHGRRTSGDIRCRVDRGIKPNVNHRRTEIVRRPVTASGLPSYPGIAAVRRTGAPLGPLSIRGREAFRAGSKSRGDRRCNIDLDISPPAESSTTRAGIDESVPRIFDPHAEIDDGSLKESAS